MKREIEDTNKCKNIPSLWNERINTVKVLYYSKWSIDSIKSLSKFHRFNELPKNPNGIFLEK